MLRNEPRPQARWVYTKSFVATAVRPSTQPGPAYGWPRAVRTVHIKFYGETIRFYVVGHT